MEKQDNQLNTISRVQGASREKVVESLRKSVDEADETKKKLKCIRKKNATLRHEFDFQRFKRDLV